MVEVMEVFTKYRFLVKRFVEITAIGRRITEADHRHGGQ